MGLAGPRKRVKISHDPNNTAWTRSEHAYGQRILSAQGWSPGGFLGAADAPHADHYSSANASHIRVLVKDGSLGVGATRHQADGKNAGLGDFQDVLGRLNGKSETQLDEENEVRKALGRRTYAAQRFGSTNFVKAGYLVGDGIEKIQREELDQPALSLTAQPAQISEVIEPRPDEALAGVELQPKPRTKKRRKANKLDEMTEDRSSIEARRQAVDQSFVAGYNDGVELIDDSMPARTVAYELKCRDKEERRKRREDKKRRREEREARRALMGSHVVPPPIYDPQPVERGTASTVLSPKSAVIIAARSQGVRHRNIQHKRMAMDPRALQEILMVKPVK